VRLEFTPGIIHGCWLTAVIHYFSSEFEGRVSGVSVQLSRWQKKAHLIEKKLNIQNQSGG